MTDETIEKPQPLEGEYQALADIAKAEQQSQQPETEKEQEPEVKTAELIFPICQFATSVFCPNWGIKEKENMQLAESYAAVLDKYFPDSTKLFGVELNALLITAAIFGPRIAAGVPRVNKPKPEKEQEKEPDKAEGGDSGES